MSVSASVAGDFFNIGVGAGIAEAQRLQRQEELQRRQLELRAMELELIHQQMEWERQLQERELQVKELERQHALKVEELRQRRLQEELEREASEQPRMTIREIHSLCVAAHGEATEEYITCLDKLAALR